MSADERILSEDPFIPVSRGERPAVLDPFMLVSITRRHADCRDLVRRTGRRVRQGHPPLSPRDAPVRYGRVLGQEIIRAIERRYRPVSHVDGYWIYVPK